MTKIDKIREKYTKAQAGKQSLQAEVADLEKKQAKLEADADKIALAGDSNGYLNAKAELERLSAEVYVKKAQLKVADNPITEEEAAEAWKEYIKEADKELKAAWTDYKKKRAALFSQMQKCMDIQRGSFLKREELGTYITGDLYQGKQLAIKKLSMFTINNNDLVHDRLMFARIGSLTAEQNILYAVLTNGHCANP